MKRQTNTEILKSMRPTLKENNKRKKNRSNGSKFFANMFWIAYNPHAK
jgi:hypothetical protein